MLTSSIASCMARHVQEALATQRKSPTELSTCVSVSMGSEVSDGESARADGAVSMRVSANRAPELSFVAFCAVEGETTWIELPSDGVSRKVLRRRFVTTDYCKTNSILHEP